MINLGIIGLGGIARGLHIPQIRKTGKFFIKAAADVYEEHPFVKDLGIPDYYSDYKKMLADPEIDAVLVLSPHDVHEEHCVAVLEAGKHLFVEKPISRNLKEASAILEAQKKSGKIGMVGFRQRFDNEHAYFKSLIDAGKFGKLYSARVDHYQYFGAPDTSWWCDPERVGGGAVIGSGVHRLDLLRWFFGEPKSVYARASYLPERMKFEACVHSVIEFESGLVANFSINWSSHDFLYLEGLSITGSEGVAVTRPSINLTKVGLSENPEGAGLKDVVPPECQKMYDHFAECIEQNKQPSCSLDEGYKSLRLVRAIYKSMETGLPVDPNEVDF